MDYQSGGFYPIYFLLRVNFRLDSFQLAHRIFSSCRVEYLYYFLSDSAEGTFWQVRFYGLFEAAA